MALVMAGARQWQIGGGLVIRESVAWVESALRKPRDQGAWERTEIYANLPTAKSVAVLDVDRDGDDDVVATFPDAKSSNVFWLPNPMSRDGADAVTNPEAWDLRAPIGQVATGADTLAIGDVDGDGIPDVVVRSTVGRIVQWFRGPGEPSKTSFNRFVCAGLMPTTASVRATR